MKNSVTLLGLASAAIIFFTSRVEAAVINLGGTNYTITASWTTYEAAESALSSTPWFGNSTLAAEAAGLVGTALGLPNSNPPFVDMGPVFAYEATLDPEGRTRIASQALQGRVGGPYTVQGRTDSATDTFYYAAATPEALQFGDFTYTANATEVSITGYTGAGGAVAIPASINGKPVKAIGEAAFSPSNQGIQSITSVTIPNSVTSIGAFAFYGLSGLTNFIFTGNAPTLGYLSFGKAAIGATVSYLSKATGWGATFGGLTTVVDYSDVFTCTTANNQATITGYTGAGGVMIIPASIGGKPVTAIGDNAFKGSISLTTVGIPASVTSIGYGAFVDCQGLDGIWVPVATVIASQAFSPKTTVFRYLTEAQLTSRDSQQNAAGQALGQAEGRALGQADVTNAPGTYGLYTAAQYAANYSSGQAAVINAPNTHGLYNLSQVQALNVDAPLLTREAVNNKFKLTIKVKKSTDLKTFSAFPFVLENSTINGNGEMEFQFTSTENAAFYRLEAR